MKMWIKCIVVICLLSFGYSSADELACPKNLDYKINVRLDTGSKTVAGREIITWTNSSAVAVTELPFHAYLNAFKNVHSTFMLEDQRGEGRRQKLSVSGLDKEGWGYCDIQAIQASFAGGKDSFDLLPGLRYIHPDDDNTLDRTLFSVKLPAPLMPQKTIVITIDFVSKLPLNMPRTGYYQDFYFVAQWFPKLGVFQGGQWNAHQFHRNCEFFADFASFDVTIAVPGTYVIGATGVLSDSTAQDDGTVSYRFEQLCVHDFAWTAYPHYRVAHKKFIEEGLPEVDIRLLYQPDNEKFMDDFFDATESTLKYFGLWYIPYPYGHLTVVDVPRKSKAMGMEYPTLFTVCSDWLEPRDTMERHSLTIHECGHQFWYGMIANNETEDAWLDEGFDTYATTRCLTAADYHQYYVKYYLQRPGFEIPRVFPTIEVPFVTGSSNKVRGNRGEDNLAQMGWEFIDGRSYTANVYDKTALMLATLEGYLGEDVFAQIMRRYSTKFLFRHPTPQDFVDVVNGISPQPMDWFFDQFLNGRGFLDYSVYKIVSQPVLAKQGLYGEDSIRYVDERGGRADQYETHITLQRDGNITIPVDVRITFENGDVVEDVWDGLSFWKKYHFTRDALVRNVEVDPLNKLAIDVMKTNNVKYRTGSSTAAFRWAMKWLFWLQHLFEVAAFFG
jgi:hypothetical protein